MIEVRVPREDVNDEAATLARWRVAAGAPVVVGQALGDLETTKTVYELAAPGEGFFHPAVPERAEVAIGSTVGWITATPDPPARPLGPAGGARLDAEPGGSPRATRKALEFARIHGLDLASLEKPGIVTLEDLKPLVASPAPHWAPPSGVRRVLVLGAGVAAMQVIDILQGDRAVALVGCLDDDPGLQGAHLLGVPVLGPLSELEARWGSGQVDAAVVGIGTRLELRRELFLRCRAVGLPLVNAIDPSARLNRHAVMGEGNVLCSFVHLGVGAVLGDNCFLAAHTSVDHHARIGSHVLLGPGCLLSGSVTIGEGTLVGSGVIIQPGLRVGEGCRIASGAVILADVPARHAVKSRVRQEVAPLGAARA